MEGGDKDYKENQDKIQELINIELKKVSLKLELKERNNSIIYPDESELQKKNSAIKKNTAFVKKIKTFSDSVKSSLIKEMKELNMTRYIEEVASAVVECKLKMGDVMPMLEFCTEINQYYQEFPRFLFDLWKKQFNTYKEEKIASKIKVDLKIYLDLIIIDILSLNEGMKLLYGVVNHLINSDTDDHSNLTILIYFLKNSGFDLIGKLPISLRESCENQNIENPTNNLLPQECRDKFGTLFENYFENVVSKLKDIHKSMSYTKDVNEKILMSKGEVSKEREEKLTGYKEKFEKLNQLCVQLADMLNKKLPNLKEVDIEDAMNDPIGQENNMETDGSDVLDLFEDEESRSFYVNLCDLKAILPGICYKDIEQVEDKEEDVESDMDIDIDAVEQELDTETEVSETGDSAIVDENSKQESMDSLMTVNATVAAPIIEKSSVSGTAGDEDKSGASKAINSAAINVAVKLPFDNFVSSLSNCINRDLIDKASQEFCEKYNTKTNRSKLVKELFNVPRNRYDLLPFYSRLVANINQITNELGSELCSLLTNELKWHIKKKIQTNLESKIKTVRFIGELVKFSVMKRNDVLQHIKMLLSQFQHHNIDMLCALLETCGRYLYRNPASHRRIDVYLSIMMRKKTKSIFDVKLSTMVENAYFYCNPPESANQFYQPEELTDEQRYLRKLLHVDLNKHSSDRVFKIVRKFNWSDNEFLKFAIQTFTEVWKIKFNNVPYLASVLAGLAPYHEELVVCVVDNVIEEIRVGMEMNNPKYNQIRISVIRYIGNFYVYKLVNATVVFNMLYSLISFGVSNSSTESFLDTHDNFFRINLIHTLLDSCGQYFKTGNIGKKLDIYFLYVQRYFLYKKSLESMLAQKSEENEPVSQSKLKSPFEALIEYQIYDMITTLRPKCKIYKNFEDCKVQVDKFEEDCIRKLKARSINLSHDVYRNENYKDSGLESIVEEDDKEYVGGDEERAETPTNFSTDENTADEEDKVVKEDMSKPRFIKCPEDDEFQQMVDQIQSESMQMHQNQQVSKIGNYSIAVPKHIKTRIDSISTVASMEESQQPETVSFALVTKKGGKNQFSELKVPREVSFVSKLIQTTHEMEQQRKSLNKVVLAMHQVQQQEEFEEIHMGGGTHVNSGHNDRRYRPNVPIKNSSEVSGVFRSNNRRK